MNKARCWLNQQTRCEICGRAIFKAGDWDFYVCINCIEALTAEDIIRMDVVEA